MKTEHGMKVLYLFYMDCSAINYIIRFNLFILKYLFPIYLMMELISVKLLGPTAASCMTRFIFKKIHVNFYYLSYLDSATQKATCHL